MALRGDIILGAYTSKERKKIMDLREANDKHRITIKNGPLSRFSSSNDKEYVCKIKRLRTANRHT